MLGDPVAGQGLDLAVELFHGKQQPPAQQGTDCNYVQDGQAHDHGQENGHAQLLMFCLKVQQIKLALQYEGQLFEGYPNQVGLIAPFFRRKLQPFLVSLVNIEQGFAHPVYVQGVLKFT